MMTNFDYLKREPKFNSFSGVAISAERIILMDPEASIINSRRAMEFALKWMYSVDKELEMPYQDNLQSLMNAEEYRQIIGPDLWKRMDFIRRCGNNVAHSGKKLGRDEASLASSKRISYTIFLNWMSSLLKIVIPHSQSSRPQPPVVNSDNTSKYVLPSSP